MNEVKEKIRSWIRSFPVIFIDIYICTKEKNLREFVVFLSQDKDGLSWKGYLKDSSLK